MRSLPLIFQVFWIDVLFALFTEKHQRAFELLSKTRVVRATPEVHEARESVRGWVPKRIERKVSTMFINSTSGLSPP